MVSREGAGWPAPDRSLSSGGIFVELDERLVEAVAHRAVAHEGHAHAVRAGPGGDRVDRGRLQLGQPHVATRGDGALEVAGERLAAAQVGGYDHWLDPLAPGRAGGEQGHAGAIRKRLGGL